MPILWCGGEDIDFMDSGSIGVTTNSGYFRATYARCGVQGGSGGFRRGPAFPGGAVTSCWISAQCGMNSAGTAGWFFGIVSTSSGVARGLWVGADGGSHIVLAKYNDTTMTTLGTSTGTYYPGNTATVHKIDMQVTNYGTSATVNVYIDQALVINFTGDVTVTGITNLNSAGIGPGFGNLSCASEVIVADFDTRSLSLMTMAPTGAGTATPWTGAYTDVNEIGVNDGTILTTNTSAQDEQLNITDLPSGTFSILAVMAATRTALAAGSVPVGIKLGFLSGGSVGVSATLTPGASFGLVEQLFATNPVTSAAWAQSDMNALQLDLQSV